MVLHRLNGRNVVRTGPAPSLTTVGHLILYAASEEEFFDKPITRC
ncbi:MAG: hypothetical protein OXN21_09575 [Chloroflexota bacterium]|nr:hypothetical protein [Chloroflexota bacterium]